MASKADEWNTRTTASGAVVFVFPSNSTPGQLHTATLDRCSCPDNRLNGAVCMHRRAIALLLQRFGLL